MYSKSELLGDNLETSLSREFSFSEKKDKKRLQSIPASPGSSDVDTQAVDQQPKDEKGTGTGVTQFLKHLLSADTMLSGAERGKPASSATRKDEQKMTAFIPPTFSMLQAQAEEITRNPTIVTSKRKTTITRVYTSQGSKPKTPPEPMSLFEKFKQKSQESILSVRSSSFRESVVPSRGQSSPSLPSHVGTEDITKSPLDLKDEQANRRLWDRMREKANREDENERQKEDKM